MALSCTKKNYQPYQEVLHQKVLVIYSARIIFILLEQKNLESHKKVCEIKNFVM